MRTTMLLVAVLLSACSTELPESDDAALSALRSTAGAIPAADDVFHGCYKEHSNANENQGELRLVSDASSCRSNEVAVSWSATGGGAAGPQGPVGPAGPAGPAGADGNDGAPGIDGADGLDGLDGLDGEDGEQGPIGPQGPPGVTPPADGPCLPGREPVFGSNECQLCAPGSFSATGAACEVCPAFGYTSVAGASQCTDCGGGAIADETRMACEMCPTNTYRVAGQGFCAPCPDGTTSSQGAVECN